MYNLTDEQLRKIAALCKQEQGSIEGAKAEATLASNLLRTSKTYSNEFGNDIYSFMRNSGWFYQAAYYMNNGSVNDEYIAAIRDVLVNGNFVLPLGVNEHDCKSDIKWIKNDGISVNKYDNSNYIPNVTRIRNVMGSEYTFYCFPAAGSDPFGYTDANKKYMEDTIMLTPLSVLSVARSWIGKNEKDGSHKDIINVYNSHTPLARGYKVQYTDKWCATFVSAVFIKLGIYTFLECGCQEMIEKLKSLGLWKSKKTPASGWIVFYDWDGDGVADHVGIVETVSGKSMVVIEGNYKDAVGRRTIDINSPYIIGFARPNYSEESAAAKEPVSTKNGTVLSKYDFHFEPVKLGDKNGYVRILQIFMTAFGYYAGPIDNWFGDDTYKAVVAYQKRRIAEGYDIGTEGKPDGVCGGKMWNDMMGV